jgi:hypothetical protein
VAGKVITIDRGMNKILAEVISMRGFVGVEVGVFDPTIAEYAAYNVYGTDKIPARDFMRRTTDVSGADIIGYKTQLASQVLGGNLTMRRALYLIGVRHAARMRDAIRTSPSWAAPNHPLTVKWKGSAHPLIHTKALLNSITYKIRGAGLK